MARGACRRVAFFAGRQCLDPVNIGPLIRSGLRSDRVVPMPRQIQCRLVRLVPQAERLERSGAAAPAPLERLSGEQGKLNQLCGAPSLVVREPRIRGLRLVGTGSWKNEEEKRVIRSPPLLRRHRFWAFSQEAQIPLPPFV